MRAICVDDEALVLELTVSMCKDMAQIDDDRSSFCGIRHDTVHRHCCFSIDAGLRDTALADSAGAVMTICEMNQENRKIPDMSERCVSRVCLGFYSL